MEDAEESYLNFENDGNGVIREENINSGLYNNRSISLIDQTFLKSTKWSLALKVMQEFPDNIFT